MSLLAATHSSPSTTGYIVIAAVVLLSLLVRNTAIMRRRGMGGPGSAVVVRCGRGHLFRATAPPTSRFGRGRAFVVRCPIDRHFGLVRPVAEGELSAEERAALGGEPPGH